MGLRPRGLRLSLVRLHRLLFLGLDPSAGVGVHHLGVHAVGVSGSGGGDGITVCGCRAWQLRQGLLDL